jgi:hypothetical protein
LKPAFGHADDASDAGHRYFFQQHFIDERFRVVRNFRLDRVVDMLSATILA